MSEPPDDATTFTASALLFDMDGTIVDSSIAVEHVWSVFAERFGLDVGEILATSPGVRMIDTIVAHTPPGVDVDEVLQTLSAIELTDDSAVLQIAGARDLMERAGDNRIAVVTSAHQDLMQRRLDQASIPRPTVTVTSTEVAHGKPAPDCYLLAAERLGVPASECVVFEDAEAGIRAGLAAGMRVIVVGDWQSGVATPLPHIPDYTAIRVHDAPGGHLKLTL